MRPGAWSIAGGDSLSGQSAAAFENTLRRLGEAKAGVTGRPQLAQVVGALKQAFVLEGAQLRAAGNLLAFRNDALHADWGKFGKSDEGTLLFVDGILQRHFS